MKETYLDTYKGLKVNSSKPRKLATYKVILDRIHREMSALQSYHSRITMVRLDLHYPDGHAHDNKLENSIVSRYLRIIKADLGSKNWGRHKRFIHGWVKEIGFEFSGDICVSERLFEYGWIVAEVTYYPSGKLRTVEIGEDVTQNYEWFENGDLRRVMLCQNDAFMLSLLFSRGLLERLTLMRDYFGRVPAVAEPIIFPILQAKQELSTFLCSAQFSLGGSGVDAEVVKYLLIGDSGRLVRSLHLDRVPGSPQLFEYLSALHQLTELKVDADKGNYGDWSKWCAEVKLFHAGCNVHLNGREISQASR